MSNDRRISAAVLTHAAKLTGQVRGTQHGAIEESFDMIGEMWSVYLNNAVHKATGIYPNPRIHVRGVDVLRMMGQLKQARALWGDDTNPDNYVDEAGYAGLAATYMGIDVSGILPPATAEPDMKNEPIPAFLNTKGSPEKDISEAVAAINAEANRLPEQEVDPAEAVEKALRGGRK